jgi:hypothetical protein
MTFRINNSNINLMLAMILGATATGKLIKPAAAFITGRLTFPTLMLGDQILEQLLIGSRIRVSMAAGLHDMANSLLGSTMSAMLRKWMSHDLPQFLRWSAVQIAMIEGRIWTFFTFTSDPAVGINVIGDLFVVELIELLVRRRAYRSTSCLLTAIAGFGNCPSPFLGFLNLSHIMPRSWV